MTDERSVTMTKQEEVPAVRAPVRIPDQPCADCLEQSPAAEGRRPGVPAGSRSGCWPGRRGQTVSTFFVLCYAGLIIPVVGVGVASPGVWTSIFGTGTDSLIPDTSEWTYE